MRYGFLLALAFASPAAFADDPKGFVPTSDYETRTVEGWSVRVNRRLLDGEHEELGRQALRLLETNLYEINRIVPEAACEVLHEVPIWLGLDDGHAPCAEYHPSRDWLVKNGYNPDKARCVEIGNARRFLDWSKVQPWMVFHELAHAYHDRVFGYDDPTIRAAYRSAMDAKRYDSVLYAGGETKTAYATTNPPEFFAEVSESFFGTNDFYPFVRAELKAHDPETFALLERLWKGPPRGRDSRGQGDDR
jgi:hypothetical protein